MEMDRDFIREARATFAREIAGLKASVRKSGQRLAELERGRRMAVAAESARRLKTNHGLAGPTGATALADAEATCAACANGRPRMPRPKLPTRPSMRRPIRPASPKSSKPQASASGPARPPPSVLER